MGHVPCSLAAKGWCDAFATGDVWELGGAQGKRTTTQVLSNLRKSGIELGLLAGGCWHSASAKLGLHRLQAKLGRVPSGALWYSALR